MDLPLVHEAEQQRQHPRYRIPANVEIDDWLYPVREWSLGGFSVAGVRHLQALSSPLPVRFVFRFDGFSATLDLDAEIGWRNPADNSIGCRFSHLGNQQLAVLRAVIDAYVAGEFLSMGDLIYITKRDNFVAKKEQQPVDEEISLVTKTLRRGKQLIGLLGLTGLFAGLLAFTLWLSYQRLYVVTGLAAVVGAPIVVIRAPQPSYFNPADLQGKEQVGVGAPLAFMELIGGGATTIDSPCECQVLDYHVLPRQFVALGEPLITLLPAGAKPYVSAQVELSAVEKITLGNSATLRLPDGTEFTGTVQQVRHMESLERRQSTPLSTPAANAIGYSEVIIAPDGEIGLDKLGMPATVTIDTF